MNAVQLHPGNAAFDMHLNGNEEQPYLDTQASTADTVILVDPRDGARYAVPTFHVYVRLLTCRTNPLHSYRINP